MSRLSSFAGLSAALLFHAAVCRGHNVVALQAVVMAGRVDLLSLKLPMLAPGA